MRVSKLADLGGHTDRAWHLSWSPATPTLASCSTDKSVRFYSFVPPPRDAPLEDHRWNFQLQSTIPGAHNRTVRSLAFSPTGVTLATASFDATVGVWIQTPEEGVDDGALHQPVVDSTSEWEPADPLEGHESECKSVAWSADGRLLASSSRDKSVWVWEAVGPADFECLAVLMDHTQDVKCVAWHPTDELLASASYDDTVKLYAADPYDDEWTCTHTLSGHTGTVWSIAFSPCGSYLASVGDDLSLRIWQRISLVDGLLKDGVREATREEGGRMGPWSNGGVRIGPKERWKWELALECPRIHERTVYSVDWTTDDADGLGRILTAGGDGSVCIHEVTALETGKEGIRISGLHRLDDVHGISDVNCAAWCKFQPSQARHRQRVLEGASTAEGTKVEGETLTALFATTGDDGRVQVFLVSSDGAAGNPTNS